MRIDMGSDENAAIFYESFIPELKTMPTRRSSLKIATEGNVILFTIKALDITAFRATMNSTLQFCNVVYGLIDYIEKDTLVHKN